MARAPGSYPVGRRFKSRSRYQLFTNNLIWSHGQAVKTSPFHGGNTGSIPVGVTCRVDLYHLLLKIKYADVAQLAEQLICNQQVIGSSPIIGFGMIIHSKFSFGPLAQLVRATGS